MRLASEMKDMLYQVSRYREFWSIGPLALLFHRVLLRHWFQLAFKRGPSVSVTVAVLPVLCNLVL